MRDVVAGFATLLGLGLLLAGGMAWHGQATSTDGPGDVPREGFVAFFLFFGAGACFFCGCFILASAPHGLARSRPDGSVRIRCPQCQQNPVGSCDQCGAPYCERHGGKRWGWFAESGADGGYSLFQRNVCDACTPAKGRLAWSLALIVLFFATIAASFFQHRWIFP